MCDESEGMESEGRIEREFIIRDKELSVGELSVQRGSA